MHASIDEIDRAALTLLHALAEHGNAIAPCFEPGHLEDLTADLVTLRQALLGLQMGPLYWEAQSEPAPSAHRVEAPSPEN